MAITGVQTFLWFNEEALDAAKFYVATFPNSCLKSVSHYQEGAQKPAGTVLVAEFDLFGQPFAALNGGPDFPHSEAVSFQIMCDTQDEVDQLWTALTTYGGQESMCGWCKDRFGISWQIIPRRLGELLSHEDRAVSQYAFSQMMAMRKIVIEDLEIRAETWACPP